MRGGLSIVEVLIAMMVIAGLGLAIWDASISTTRGVGADRLQEAVRHVKLDILERCCQPYSVVPQLFAGLPKPYRRVLTLDESFELIGMDAGDARTLKAILTAGGVEGFTLMWEPGRGTGKGKKALALRLDVLSVIPALKGDSPGPRVESFRVFFTRGEAGL